MREHSHLATLELHIDGLYTIENIYVNYIPCCITFINATTTITTILSSSSSSSTAAAIFHFSTVQVQASDTAQLQCWEGREGTSTVPAAAQVYLHHSAVPAAAVGTRLRGGTILCPVHRNLPDPLSTWLRWCSFHCPMGFSHFQI